MKISGSIVLFKHTIGQLMKLLASLYSSNMKLFLIDNSKIEILGDSTLNCSRKIELIYIHNPSNPGFGAAHNIAIKKAIDAGSKYHFIINPDIIIEEDVFTPMINYMEQNPDVGMLMPKVLNEDGTIQHLPKLLPHPAWIFRRKLKKIDLNHQKFINKYELRDFSKDQILNVPILSGCFTLLRLDAIKEVGMYDENFFMYFEDFDLSRRMHQKYKTVYFPEVCVYHGYEGGANKSFKLFKIFLKSMFTYFNKWGWFNDKERKEMNKSTLEQFKS
ncbi:glycosyltransferase family 2 protein [Pedobacter aquae]|uniref:Glycosyltransferase family 2 protein n=1 Tax=Pedobacter aquae TaxID=2605747 RepID=A0A5C0VHS0_9SPHI|nr:glycosyltransferase family 2 protein [Pedobacter aquae]QEK52205.1 glycosyltransferase family 2 protein [Pedobacter aquae]